jgi:hypothetical protein
MQTQISLGAVCRSIRALPTHAIPVFKGNSQARQSHAKPAGSAAPRIWIGVSHYLRPGTGQKYFTNIPKIALLSQYDEKKGKSDRLPLT